MFSYGGKIFKAFGSVSDKILKGIIIVCRYNVFEQKSENISFLSPMVSGDDCIIFLAALNAQYIRQNDISYQLGSRLFV